MDGFHYYLSYIKFGIGRATSDSAHEVRDNKITREEGVSLIKKFDGEFPSKYFKEFLEFCSINFKLSIKLLIAGDQNIFGSKIMRAIGN